MGGKAFASLPNPPNIVRLPPATYQALCKRFKPILRKIFTQVFIPPEAPGKLDHGDVDVLIVNKVKDGAVSGIKEGKGINKEELSKILGARRCINGAGGWSFAVPVEDEQTDGKERNDGRGEELFQLDINAVKAGNWEWECMVNSYGDLWRIVGGFVTKFGLTVNNSGLSLRVAEIEKKNRALSLIQLTSEPKRMMEFLDLAVKGFGAGEGFESLEEMFQWVTRSKYFRRSGYLKAGRVKEEVRPMYWSFVGEWLPAHPEVGVTTAFVSREHALEIVLDEFGKREEYFRKLEEHRKCMRKDYLWKRVKETLPLEGKDLREAIVALKNFVVWNDGAPILLDERDQSLVKIPDLGADIVESALIPWARENWQKTVDHARSHPFESRSAKE